MKITPVILSGGSGTRLWPLSRQMYPKQFINLHGDLTMLQEADHGILFRPPETLREAEPQMPVTHTHEELKSAIEAAFEGRSLAVLLEDGQNSYNVAVDGQETVLSRQL